MQRDIVVIGASAGGIDAIGKVLRDLPADLPATIFVVVHIPASVDSILPQIWNRVSHLKVLHPPNGQKMEAGRVYVAPPNHHLVCENGRVEVSKGPTENRHRPSVDTLFRSAAHNFGSRVIGVVLTGSLDDGTSGLWHIKRRGGIAIVQSPQDAEYAGMPLSAIKSVEIDYTLPIKEMGQVIASLCKGEPLPHGEPQAAKLSDEAGDAKS